MILGYVESTLSGLNIPLDDSIVAEEGGLYRESALLVGWGAGDAGFGIGTRRRSTGGGAAESIGGGGGGSRYSVCLATPGGEGLSFCFEARCP